MFRSGKAFAGLVSTLSKQGPKSNGLLTKWSIEAAKSSTSVNTASFATFTHQKGDKKFVKNQQTSTSGTKASGERAVALEKLYLEKSASAARQNYLKTTPESEISIADLALFFSHNPRSLPPALYQEALKKFEEVDVALDNLDFSNHAENTKILVFFTCLVQDFDPKVFKDFDANISRAVSPKSLVEDEKSAKFVYEFLVYLNGYIFQDKIDPKFHQQSLTILKYITLYEQSINFSEHKIINDIANSQFNLSKVDRQALTNLMRVTTRTIQRPELQQNESVVRATDNFLEVIKAINLLWKDQTATLYYRNLFDLLIAKVEHHGQGFIFNLANVFIVCIESRTKAMETMTISEFIRFNYCVTTHQLHRVHKNTEENYWEAASRYIINNVKMFNSQNWKSLLYSVGKSTNINAEARDVMAAHCTPAHYAKFRKEKSFPILFRNLILCGTNMLFVNKDNISQYYADIATILDTYEREGWTDATSQYYLTLAGALVRAECYSWEFWKYFAKNQDKLFEAKGTFPIFYVLKHFKLFLDEVDDPQTKSYIETMMNHETAQEILNHNIGNFRPVFTSTVFMNSLVSRLEKSGIKCEVEHPMEHVLIDCWLTNEKIAIEMMGQHHYLARNEGMNVLTLYRKKVYEKIGIDYIFLSHDSTKMDNMAYDLYLLSKVNEILLSREKST